MNSEANETKFGKYSLKTLTRDNVSKHQVSADSSYVCLLPFEKNGESGIKSIFLLQFPNSITGKPEHSLIVDEVDSDTDTNTYESVRRALTEEAGLNLDELRIDENKIFYLGEITTSFPATSTMTCYGIDLTGLGQDGVEFTRNLSKDVFIRDQSSIVKAGFHQIVNGDYTDATVLSGAFLLVSYFS